MLKALAYMNWVEADSIKLRSAVCSGTKDKCIIHSISDFAAGFHFHIAVRMLVSSETA